MGKREGPQSSSQARKLHDVAPCGAVRKQWAASCSCCSTGAMANSRIVVPGVNEWHSATTGEISVAFSRRRKSGPAVEKAKTFLGSPSLRSCARSTFKRCPSLSDVAGCGGRHATQAPPRHTVLSDLQANPFDLLEPQALWQSQHRESLSRLKPFRQVVCVRPVWSRSSQLFRLS